MTGRVKPLIWTDKGGASTPFGNYVVAEADNTPEDGPFWFVYFAGKPYGKCGEHVSPESAKLACQRDYETRILSALEPSATEAALRAQLADWQAAQGYRYIGKDGKPVLARDLEDQRNALRAQVEALTEALRVNGLRAGFSHADIDEVIRASRAASAPATEGA